MGRLAWFFVGFLSLGAQEVPSPKQVDVAALVKVMGMADLAVSEARGAMVEARNNKAPGLPDAFFTELESRMSPAFFESLFIQVLNKHLTHEEVKALLVFYRTPEGAAWAKKQAVIAAEAKQAGEKLGKELALSVMQDLVKQGKM